MKFKVEPYDGGYRVTCNGWGVGVTFATYEGALAVVNGIDQFAKDRDTATVVDYSACLQSEPEKGDTYPDPQANGNGTSLQGYLDPIKYTDLVAKLGEPHQGVSGDDKVDAEWFFQTPAGTATIYNYKSGPAYNPGENIKLEDVDDWHIGGKTEAVVPYIKQYMASR